MTDPKVIADAIDPRNGHLESGKKSLHVQVPIADAIAASDTIRTQQSRIEELESAAALAGKMAIEKAARIVERAAGEDPDDAAARIRSLSKPIDRNALIERGARALYEETPLEEGGETIDGFEVSPTSTVTWAQIIEHDGYAEIASDFRRMSSTVLSAWIGEETK